jgi:TonB family protein
LVAPDAKQIQTAGSGTIAQNSVIQTINKYRGAIKYCYERELKNNPSLAGKIVAVFTIGSEGEVRSFQIVNSTLSPSVGDCVAEKIKRLRFSKPKGGEVTVRMPFIFTISGG